MVFRILDEGIHSEDNKLGLSLCIVHKIQVYKLLLFQIICLHVLEHIGEETAHVCGEMSRFSDLVVRRRDNRAPFPTVIDAMTRLMASFRLSRYSLLRSTPSS